MKFQINTNDILILKAIVNKEDNRGLSKAKGSTVNQIQLACGLSDSKVRKTLKKFIEEEWVGEGVKVLNIKRYYVTEKGLKELSELRRTNVVVEDN